MPEIEYGGIKVKGGKLLLILPLLGTLGGAIWGGFEGYARWVAMETKIDRYVAPDLSNINKKVSVFEKSIENFEKTLATQDKIIKGQEKIINTKIVNIESTLESQETLLKSEVNGLQDSIIQAQDTVRDIRTDLKNEIHDMGDQISAIDKRSREADRIVRESIRTSEMDVRNVMKEVEKENTGLRKLVADLSLDKAILKEVAEGKY